MGLIGALNIGRTGLTVNQAAMEVVGNNLANAASESYNRQSPIITPNIGQELAPGLFVGTGVKFAGIVRHADEALLARLRLAISDRAGTGAQYELLSQIEAIQNELTDQGLSNRLTEFFNTWSQLANNPTDNSLRVLVIQGGRALTEFVNRMQRDLVAVRNQLDDTMRATAVTANGLLDRIAELNGAIANAEAGAGGANALRDDRDRLLVELSEIVDISTVEQTSGVVDVFVGSIPIVLAGQNRGLDLSFESEGDDLTVRLRVAADGEILQPTSGKLGLMLQAREQDVNSAVQALNDFAAHLIFQVNRVHSQGQGTEAFDDLTATYAVDDTAAALTLADAGLEFTPEHGSFMLHVTQQSTGTRVTTRIDVDLDGLGGADMSLEDLRDAINADPTVGPMVTASITTEGRLNITANSPDDQFSFSDDTSGVLAALGLNTFFAGKDGADIAVNDVLIDTPARLAVGLEHVVGDNRSALAIVGLNDQSLDALGGISLPAFWSRHIEDMAIRTSAAQQAVEADQVIVESLEAQRQAISGVDIDEETINLLAYQRAFQGSARFISAVDEMLSTLLGLLR